MINQMNPIKWITMPSYSDNSDDTDFSIHSSSGSDSQDHSDSRINLLPTKFFVIDR